MCPLTPSVLLSEIWSYQQLILIWQTSNPFPQINLRVATKILQNLGTPHFSFKYPWFINLLGFPILSHASAQALNGSHQKPEKLWLQIRIIVPLIRFPLLNRKLPLFPNPSILAYHCLPPKISHTVCSLPKLIFQFFVLKASLPHIWENVLKPAAAQSLSRQFLLSPDLGFHCRASSWHCLSSTAQLVFLLRLSAPSWLRVLNLSGTDIRIKGGQAASRKPLTGSYNEFCAAHYSSESSVSSFWMCPSLSHISFQQPTSHSTSVYLVPASHKTFSSMPGSTPPNGRIDSCLPDLSISVRILTPAREKWKAWRILSTWETWAPPAEDSED